MAKVDAGNDSDSSESANVRPDSAVSSQYDKDTLKKKINKINDFHSTSL